MDEISSGWAKPPRARLAHHFTDRRSACGHHVLNDETTPQAERPERACGACTLKAPAPVETPEPEVAEDPTPEPAPEPADLSDLRALVARRQVVAAEIGTLSEEKAELDEQIRQAWGDAPTAQIDGQPIGTWQHVESLVLDQSLLKAEYPEAYQACKQPKRTRPLRITWEPTAVEQVLQANRAEPEPTPHERHLAHAVRHAVPELVTLPVAPAVPEIVDYVDAPPRITPMGQDW